ncbi:MAG: hypothetical protein IT452_04810 [Planctomycetia bacterium]|nr:hypothetical protein [Planctomycetia bacterium]
MKADELQRRLLAALERIEGEVLRQNRGYDRPDPGKLIREGLRIARRCVEGVPLAEADYLGAVARALEEARRQQDACGLSDDGWKDEDGYITSGIGDALREVEKLRQGRGRQT